MKTLIITCLLTLGLNAVAQTNAFKPVPPLTANTISNTFKAVPKLQQYDPAQHPLPYKGPQIIYAGNTNMPIIIMGGNSNLVIRTPGGQVIHNVTYQPVKQPDAKFQPVKSLNTEANMTQAEKTALNKAMAESSSVKLDEPARYARLLSNIQDANRLPEFKAKRAELEKIVSDYVLKNDPQDIESLEKLKKPLDILSHAGNNPVLIY